MLCRQVLSQDMLKKYITYAKLNVFPKIHDADLDKISHVYAELRRESSVSSHSFGVLYRASHELYFVTNAFEKQKVNGVLYRASYELYFVSDTFEKEKVK